jgi:hypothetical protein
MVVRDEEAIGAMSVFPGNGIDVIVSGDEQDTVRP